MIAHAADLGMMFYTGRMFPEKYHNAIFSAQPVSAGGLAAGKAKAEAMCQTCHRIDGKATIPTAANLSGQQKGYLVAQLQAYRSGKRRHEQMGIIAKMLSDQETKIWRRGIHSLR